MSVRVPSPGKRYDQQDEAAFRRIVEQELSKEPTEIHIAGAIIYVDAGVVKIRGTAGTVTIIGPA